MEKIIPNNAVLIPDQAAKVFSGQIFDVYQWPQKLYDGSEHTFEMLKRPDTVVIIGVVEGKLIIVEDIQPHFGSRHSFPGGRVDKTDPTIEAAASREMQEETGYSFKKWRLISVLQPYLKMEWFVHYLIAWDEESQQKPNLDAGEKIKVSQVSFDDLKKIVLNKAGYLGESMSLIGKLENIDEMLSLPEFEGKVIDR
ncbi:MAG TPA: NUDIX domain-containing protein [Candidatus Saccharimonadales bacterium]|nr:NUDIX domain-containing protein [Candidatus Saccharimonadales bacterium]